VQLILLFVVMTSVFSASESSSILKAVAEGGHASYHVEVAASRLTDLDESRT
jgi:hypothetical protein